MGLGWQFKSCPGQVGLCLFEVMFGHIQGCQATIVKKSEILGKEGGDIRDFWGDIRIFGVISGIFGVLGPHWRVWSHPRHQTGEKGDVGYFLQRKILSQTQTL